ncbi:restriction endonuclease subunit S [Crenobacter intestini]|uniref:Restriction endonuclease n=1 Tax=Crenobacter intestini TaxID=2563443 RepID=A0A4T0UK15_9NEIS|nr:restriction endonuclease subunit S [Crenobacter intestini]TIC78950.1 restriction endonuclease [Crenobacter intestini]
MSENQELPHGWIELEFGDLFSQPGDDIVDGPFGSNLKASEYVSAGIPIARLQNIDRNRFIAKNIQYVTDHKAEELARHTFAPGDILITKLGDPLGKACLAPSSIPRGVLVADVVRARLTHPWIDRDYLCYQINAEYMVEQFKGQTKGTTRPRVNLTKIRTLKARLCPLPEQTRIVAKLEELLSDLDAGVAELKAAQQKLAQYRQSLLKAAVEGALTADWRAQHTVSESGEQLLARILSERRARWEARQLAKFAEQGKTPPKNWQQKYPEPVTPDTTGLPALPEGWVWASLDSLISDGPQNGLYLPASRYGFGVPILRIDDYQIGWCRNKSDLNLVDADEETKNTYSLVAGDLVINRVNSMTHLGKSLLVGKVLNGVLFESNMMRFSLASSVSGGYVSHYLGSDVGRNRLIRDSKWAVNQASINQQDVKRTPVPLPPEAEQHVISELLEEQLSAAADQVQAAEISIKQASAQRQNILRAAFAGELVPQDPNDEPASVLLARIRAVRAEQAAVKKPRGRRAKTA